MAAKFLIINTKIVNEGKILEGSIFIEDQYIREVFDNKTIPETILELEDLRIIDGRGKYLLPGIIDDQVHFREPGLTQKGDLYTESKAAVAGGVTSFMDMPNTVPKATTIEVLEEKYKLASQKSLANYSFFLGATNDNFAEIEKCNATRICGVKVFMGSSTGNMLVDNPESLEKIFSGSPLLIAVHAEDEPIIQENIRIFKEKYGEDIPIEAHPLIRSEEACFKSSEKAVSLAKKHGARLHLLHLSTAREINLLDNSLPLKDKKITGEVCVHHLWFDDRDYKILGSKIKWNPAIKKESDKLGLLASVLNNKIDIIATDHAPHLIEEKKHPYLSCPSGAPLIQHSLIVMLELYHQGAISLEKIVEKMCHAPSIVYRINKRGFIRPGYFADLVLVDIESPWEVNPSNILYKCGWSPLEGKIFRSRVTHTFVNGHMVYSNGKFDENCKGMRLEFNRK